MPIEVILDRPGRSPLRVTPQQENLRWSSAAIGGFRDATFRLAGDPAHWRREIPFLATVRLVLDTLVIWEGRVEDIGLVYTGGGMGAEITCLGFQRLLDDVSVRRIWSMRDLDWLKHNTTGGRAFDIQTGAYDDTDQTKVGVRFEGNGGTFGLNNAVRVKARAPVGLTWTRFMATYDEFGTNQTDRVSTVYSSINGTALTLEADPAGTTINTALTAGTRIVYIGMRATSAHSVTETDGGDFRDIRLLGTSLIEDATGGFYGGTILRDLIALVPGLTIGVIETGNDFTIEAIERAIRSSCRSVVDEVASYYDRYWAVWQDATFEWREHHLDEPHWLATVPDLSNGTELHGTVDGTAKTVYVLYTDVDDTEREKTATSTDQRNPWVKQGRQRDEIIDLGALHPGARGPKRINKIRKRTAATAQKHADRLASDLGRYPAVEGTIVLPIDRNVRRIAGGPLPAYMIRGGETIAVNDLPKTDLFATGRDGETLFHIVAAEADYDRGEVILEIEGQTSRTDLILARLAALTRQ